MAHFETNIIRENIKRQGRSNGLPCPQRMTEKYTQVGRERMEDGKKESE